MWLCLQRAEPTRRPRSSGTGPSLASTAGQGVLLTGAGLCFSARPAVPTALLLQKVVQGAELVANDPTLVWLLVPGTSWVEGGHVPQALACIFLWFKGIPYFSQFTWLIHSVILLLSPLSLPGPTMDS